MEYVEGKGIEKVSVLPRRIDPCTWEQIKYYMANPANHAKPLPSEVPTADDWAVLKGTLTEEKRLQLRVVELQLEAEARAERVVKQETRAEVATNGPKFAGNTSGNNNVHERAESEPPKNVAELLTQASATLGFNMGDIQEITGIENVMEIDDFGAAWTQLLEAKNK